MTELSDGMRRLIDIEACRELTELDGNSVVYSEKAWAAARKSSSGDDRWFADGGAWYGNPLTAVEMIAWADDWEVLRGEARD